MIEDSATDAKLTLLALKRARITNPLKILVTGELGLDYLFGLGSDAKHDLPQPLIILLDLNLPGMPGVEFLRRIRIDPRTWNIPVAILTESKSARKISACMRMGLDDYLLKPVDLASLVGVMKRLKLQLTMLPKDAAPADAAPRWLTDEVNRVVSS